MTPFASSSYKEMVFKDLGQGRAKVEYGPVAVELREDGFTITADKPFVVENRIGVYNDHMMQVEKLTENAIALSYQGFGYGLEAAGGRFVRAQTIASEGNAITITINNK